MLESGQPVGLVAEGAEAKANADYSDLKRSTRTTESGAGAQDRAKMEMEVLKGLGQAYRTQLAQVAVVVVPVELLGALAGVGVPVLR